MTALRNLNLYEELSADQAFWLTLVRAACHSVSSKSSAALSAATVSHRFAGSTAAELAALVSLARDAAEEMGVSAEIEDEGERITVRFSRPQPSTSPETRRPQNEESRPTALRSGGLWQHLFGGRTGSIAS